MTARVRAAAVVPLLLLVSALVLFADVDRRAFAAADGKADCFRCGPTGTAAGGRGGIDVTVIKGVSDQVSGRGDGKAGPAPGRETWFTVDEYATPACAGNTLNGFDAMCGAALTCPADNLVRFWVWHQVTEWAAGDPPTKTRVNDWAQEPGSFCLGPDDPGITPIGLVIAQVQSGFQNLPLPKFDTEIRPVPTTLVNVPTSFAAGTADPVTLTTEPLAGIVVTVTAKPAEWRWTFGDGTSATTTVPGRPGTDDVTHLYERAQTFGASVRVAWTGTFTLPGSSEVFQIRTPAYVQGPVAQVDVREARTELVRD